MAVLKSTVMKGKITGLATDYFRSGGGVEYETIEIDFPDGSSAVWKGKPEAFRKVLQMLGLSEPDELIDLEVRAGANDDNACVIGHPTGDKWVEGIAQPVE